jgi:hypothetical protein
MTPEVTKGREILCTEPVPLASFLFQCVKIVTMIWILAMMWQCYQLTNSVYGQFYAKIC